MPDLPVITSGIHTQREPNTRVFDAPVEITGGLWINCRLPDGSVVSGGNIMQVIYYVETVEIDGQVVVLQDVQHIWVGRGVLGEVTKAPIDAARVKIPAGGVELTEAMWDQWRAGEAITLEGE